MICKIAEFESLWQQAAEGGRRLYAALTDASLNQPVTTDDRTLGRLAWHVVQSIPEMAERTGLRVEGPHPDEPVPPRAEDMRNAFDRAADSIMAAVKAGWTDATLAQEDDMYGEMWSRGKTLTVIILHQVHHFGQMTVLMRQAGLNVPGLYGPSREEWARYGAQPPAI